MQVNQPRRLQLDELVAEQLHDRGGLERMDVQTDLDRVSAIVDAAIEALR